MLMLASAVTLAVFPCAIGACVYRDFSRAANIDSEAQAEIDESFQGSALTYWALQPIPTFLGYPKK